MELDATSEKALKAIVEGPFIEDWEFQTLIGVSRADLEASIRDESVQSVMSGSALIRNVALNLLGYPHGKETLLRNQFDLTEPELEKLLSKYEGE